MSGWKFDEVADEHGFQQSRGYLLRGVIIGDADAGEITRFQSPHPLFCSASNLVITF
jgi:hypothetical protein